MSSFDLIPGTALPIQQTAHPGSPQPEGRGTVTLAPGRAAPEAMPNFEQPSLSPDELALVKTAVASYDRTPRRLKTIYAAAGGQTDATTGNLILPLFLCPAGCEGHVSNVTVDAPGSATINPSAPFSNGASWEFLAKSGSSTGMLASQADTLRRGLVAFAPTSTAGPIIPGQWTFNDTNAPVLFGNEQLYYVLHGGSVAAILALALQVTYRIDLFGFEDGRL
jgi:hypothetical protein